MNHVPHYYLFNFFVVTKWVENNPIEACDKDLKSYGHDVEEGCPAPKLSFLTVEFEIVRSDFRVIVSIMKEMVNAKQNIGYDAYSESPFSQVRKV